MFDSHFISVAATENATRFTASGITSMKTFNSCIFFNSTEKPDNSQHEN